MGHTPEESAGITGGILTRLAGGLIVSCQAAPGHPLHNPQIIAAMASAAVEGGAVGVRINGEADVRAARRAVTVPIIGLRKVRESGFDVYITPGFDDARAVAEAGADIIAIDATPRSRPGGGTAEELIARIQSELGLPVLADIASEQEGVMAASWGADLVATTLSGYTANTPKMDDPDIALVRRLVGVLRRPVVAEGRYSTPQQAREALDAGAFAIVVGRAISDPRTITRTFVDGLRRVRP